MTAYIITYDLKRPGQNYDALWQALRQLDAARALESVWFMSPGRLSPTDVHAHLRPHLDSNDKLYVGAVTAPAIWSNLGANWDRWLQGAL